MCDLVCQLVWIAGCDSRPARTSGCVAFQDPVAFASRAESVVAPAAALQSLKIQLVQIASRQSGPFAPMRVELALA